MPRISAVGVPPQAAALVDALQLFDALPQHIRQRAVAPKSALAASEPSLRATRLRAFDDAGQLCLYRHSYTLAEIDFDSDDTPYVRVTLHEILTAVRTAAGPWLQRTQRWKPESGGAVQDSGFLRAARFSEP